MKIRISKKSVLAILSACVCALPVLFTPAAVLAVALALLFFLYRTANKKRGNTTPRPKNKAPEFSAECSIMATAATKVKSK